MPSPPLPASARATRPTADKNTFAAPGMPAMVARVAVASVVPGPFRKLAFDSVILSAFAPGQAGKVRQGRPAQTPAPDRRAIGLVRMFEDDRQGIDRLT